MAPRTVAETSRLRRESLSGPAEEEETGGGGRGWNITRGRRLGAIKGNCNWITLDRHSGRLSTKRVRIYIQMYVNKREALISESTAILQPRVLHFRSLIHVIDKSVMARRPSCTDNFPQQRVLPVRKEVITHTHTHTQRLISQRKGGSTFLRSSFCFHFLIGYLSFY